MNKKIEFYTETKEIYDSIPHPMPASKFIPKWFKNLQPDLENDSTIKRCMPFLDSLTAGYIIPLWQDIYFNTGHKEDGTPFINYSWSVSLIPNADPLSNHSYDQIEGSDISKTPLGRYPIKFNNPWVIKTPPGYSCLFVNPLNHYNEDFELISAIVDTDTYTSNIDFPFVFLNDNFNDIVPRGTPLVQVIPFKRETWKSSVGAENKIQTQNRLNVSTKLRTVFKKGYRRFFWHKKTFQ